MNGVRLSLENSAIFTGSPEQVAGRIESLLRQRAANSKDLAPQVHILDGVKLMDFSSLTAQEHIVKAVHDELKKATTTTTTTKNVAAIVTTAVITTTPSNASAATIAIIAIDVIVPSSRMSDGSFANKLTKTIPFNYLYT